MNGQNGFVADGYSRLYEETFSTVRQQVLDAYAERWEQASYWERHRLRWKMNRELMRRMREKMPSAYTLW